jgi:hypothetical protein
MAEKSCGVIKGFSGGIEGADQVFIENLEGYINCAKSYLLCDKRARRTYA